jgi:hypothetical protein
LTILASEFSSRFRLIEEVKNVVVGRMGEGFQAQTTQKAGTTAAPAVWDASGLPDESDPQDGFTLSTALAPTVSTPSVVLAKDSLPTSTQVEAAPGSIAAAPTASETATDPWSAFQVSPQNQKKYDTAVHSFVGSFLHLSPEETSKLQVVPSFIEGGSLNFEVSNLPSDPGERTIVKPDGMRSALQKNAKDPDLDNFYVDLPKGVRPPGAGHVAHVIVDETPAPEGDNKVVLADHFRMHFDVAAPNDLVGIIGHLVGDLGIGNLASKKDPEKPIK